MPRAASTADVVTAVRTLAAAHPRRTVWVGIDGFGGAGKTTLATAVAAAVERATVVHVDDFDGEPEWDWARFRDELHAPLLVGRPARYAVSSWGEGLTGQWHEVPVGAVIVVEGVSSTRSELPVAWDLTVWVDAPRDVRLRRALARDGEALLPVWLERWMPSEDAYAARERPQQRVDLIVDGGGTG